MTVTEPATASATTSMIAHVQTSARHVLIAARLPDDLLHVCDASLSRPGRLFSATPIASRLFLAWIATLAPAASRTLLPAAVACEFALCGYDLIDYHTDDLALDGTTCARPPQTPRGNPTSLLAGITLLLVAQEQMSTLDAPHDRYVRAQRTLTGIGRKALAAHYLDTALRSRHTARPETALAILRQRSGQLIALPCVCAAVLVGADPRLVVLARRFGRALGCAGQLADDRADRQEDDATGRKTLPLLLAQMEPKNPMVAEAAIAVLTHRFLEEAAAVLRNLSTFALYDSEALWELLPGELRSSPKCSAQRSPHS